MGHKRPTESALQIRGWAEVAGHDGNPILQELSNYKPDIAAPSPADTGEGQRLPVQFAHDKPKPALSNSLVSKESGKKDMIPSSEEGEGVLVDFLYRGVNHGAGPFAETFRSKVEEYGGQVKVVGTCPTVENEDSPLPAVWSDADDDGDSVGSGKPMTTDYHFVV